MKIRRVVTGHDSGGRSVVASDSEVEATSVALLPGTAFYLLWGADRAPRFPDEGAPPASVEFFPPRGGFRFMTFTVPPESELVRPEGGGEALVTEMQQKLPGLLAHMERSSPGMHTTDTIDFEYVIAGEVWLELDGGKEVHLKAGDTVVQNGTRHAWRNHSRTPCRIVVFMLGTEREPPGLELAARRG